MVRLPSEQRQRIAAIRAAQLRDISEAVDELDAKLGAEVRQVLKAIKRSGYRRSVILSQTALIVAKHTGRLRKTVAKQVEQAALYADRQADVIKAWRLAGKLAQRPDVPTPAQVRFAETQGRGGAQAALAPGDTITRKPPRPMTFAGDKAAAAEKLPLGRHRLSTTLHRSIAANTEEVRQEILRAVREAENLDSAGRSLIREVRRQSVGELGQGQRIPRLVKRLQRAGAALAESGGDPVAKRAWTKALARVGRYAETLKDQRGGYLELLQIIRKKGPEGLDKALTRWVQEKQRYNAERLIRSEAAAARRAQEAVRVGADRHIAHVIWRMSGGARKSYVRLVKPGGKGSRNPGRRCICESLAGQKFSKSAMLAYPYMGHPNCLCYWEQVLRSR